MVKTPFRRDVLKGFARLMVVYTSHTKCRHISITFSGQLVGTNWHEICINHFDDALFLTTAPDGDQVCERSWIGSAR